MARDEHDQRIGTGSDCEIDLGYRIQCFESPRIQFPCNDPIGIRPDTLFTFPASFPQMRTKDPRWYTIKTAAFSIEREFAGAGPSPSTRDSDVINGDNGAGALKLSVIDGENNRFAVDIGQGRNFSVFSRGLSARIEAPPGSTRVENTSPGPVIPAAPLPFFMCDAIINVSIGSGIAPLGGQNGTLSRLYQVVIPGANDFVIPARAQRVQFSIFAPFGVVTPIARFASNVTSPTPSRLFFSSVTLAVGETTTGFIDVPGDATSITFPLAASLDVMAVWEISW